MFETGYSCFHSLRPVYMQSVKIGYMRCGQELELGQGELAGNMLRRGG